MTRRRGERQRGARRASARGFALPFVLALLLIASLMIGAAMQREATQRLAVERALLQYRRHHETFGVRAVVQKWLGRMGSSRRLESLIDAAAGGPVFHFELPGGTQIDVYAADGQGSMLENIDSIVSGDFDLYADILSRVPPERLDLVRTVGPLQISIRSAPREILEALVPSKDRRARFAQAAQAQQRRDQLSPQELAQLLRRYGDVGDDADRIAALFTVNPTLWRLRVEADDGAGLRLFDGYVEIVDGDPLLRRWMELPSGADAEEVGGDAAEVARAR